MVTLHPTSKSYAGGFIPMVTVRSERGRMLGCKVPQGEAKDWHTFSTALEAECVARCIALRVATRVPTVMVA